MARDAAALARRSASCCARTVTIKVRYDDFTTITRSHTRRRRRATRRRSSRAPSRCSSSTDAGRRPVRLLGVSVHNLTATLSPQAPPPPEGPQRRLPFGE